MENPQPIYWADGAGSRAIYTSLRDVLDELCAAVLSDRALALYRPATARRGYRVLSDSAGESEAAIANEPMAVNSRLDFHRPTTVSGFVARSRLRRYQAEFGSAISVPWSDPFGHGVVLIGVEEPYLLVPTLERVNAAAAGERLARIVDQSRMSGTVTLQHQMRTALREVLDSHPAGRGRLGRLNALVNAAQKLFGSDTAYLALPDDGHSARYYFASLANVNTPQFRQLRMDFGQGLGGLARRERKVVSSLKYDSDDRLLAPPKIETLNEGIQSAMAAPLVRAGSVEGVLYVGSRTLHPYSDTDEMVLEELADYISMVLGEPAYKGAVYDSRSSRLREEFAHAIHDTVVRSLVQIGFTAEQAAMSARTSPEKNSIETIQRAAEEALANLRNELRGLVDQPSTRTVTLAEVLDDITAVPVRPGLTRNVYVAASDGQEQLPAEVGEVLIHIGTEALTNSMLHSSCTTERVQASMHSGAVQLTVTDDGVGAPAVSRNGEALSASGHFGVRSMYRRAAAVNGILLITSGPRSGTTVSVEIPRTW